MDANDVSPIRQQINEIRSSKAYQDNLHPSHEDAMRTIADLYSREFPEPDAPLPSSEEVEGTLKEAQALRDDMIKVDDPVAAKIQEALQPLREEWKGDFEKNVTAAQGLVEHLAREMGLEAIELFDDIGSDATIIRVCYEWSQGRDGGDVSPDEAKRLIGLIQKSRVYQAGSSQTSEVLRNVVAALYTVAYQ